ncbi:ferrochelatase [Corynebacterium felinum]|uniref:Coproporphyrin III ferrochelatase n=1 Tax=Corynebacterium felinum TaxID=131318 RepID=A0ABU2BAR5_9CORY|nr:MULTISPECIES: ferrochelatase [Corynebacterium]MDF5820035.1 ferrochelatase [Corynebacterium felinum]MDO4760408.1 ferrochelatase [Corynebacterium sp.]MDR7355695.1 ferrochelatase [Corynebacterium felinum]WJY95045.1 Ferrochelatase [Corynebacterium felinum]
MNTPVDALLLLSFGGPEKPEDVMPFLRNVTRGRGIPDSRLEEVAVHYHHFDGYSPLNDCNREIISNIETELGLRGISLPIYFGNRNWAPYASDVALEIARAGHKKVAVFATSAWGGYSGCRQYAEDIALMLETLNTHNAGHVDFYRLRQFFDHPEFIEGNVHAINDAYEAFSRQGINKDEIRLVFTAHSIPIIADTNSGTAEDGPLYSRQVNESARLVAQQLGVSDYDVVWQSASGDGKVPWLDPDIVDHAHELHAQGVNNLVVCSIGFISDHMEVVWDLDNELQEEAEEMGMKVVRAATVGHTKEFASMVVDLLFETFGYQPPLHLGTVPSKGCTVNGSPCEVDCCQPAKRPHSITA